MQVGVEAVLASLQGCAPSVDWKGDSVAAGLHRKSPSALFLGCLPTLEQEHLHLPHVPRISVHYIEAAPG